MGLLKVHYKIPRRVAYLDFAKSPEKVGHSESALLIKYVYKKTAVKETAKVTPFIWFLETALDRDFLGLGSTQFIKTE
jgi:hypothetical protein